MRLSPTLSTIFTYCYLKAEYVDYNTSDGDFGGDRLPGLPVNQAYLKVADSDPAGYYVIPRRIRGGDGRR